MRAWIISLLILAFTAARCAATNCPALATHPAYTLIPATCSTGTHPAGTECLYYCSQSGMLGSALFSCIGGHWNGVLPQCTPAPCAPVVSVQHGHAGSCGGSRCAGDSCVPVCESGHGPQAPVFHCLGAGPGVSQWDRQPACVPLTCPPLTAPTNGVIQQCTRGGDDGNDDDDDNNDNNDNNGNNGGGAGSAFGAVCTIHCNAGYTISGPPATCAVIEPTMVTWVGGQTCVANRCQPLPSNHNLGLASFTSACTTTQIASGASCTLTCSTWGYAGSVARTCVLGVWSQPAQPICHAVSCTTVPAIANIAPGSCVPTQLGQLCSPTCALHYSYVGGLYTCMATGPGAATLTGPSPVGRCVATGCPAIQQDSMHTAGCAAAVSGATCTLTCNSGTVPQSGMPLVLACNGSSWTIPANIQCAPESCDVSAFTASLGTPSAALTVACPTESAAGYVADGATCLISCQPGYGGSQPVTVTCSGENVFSPAVSSFPCAPVVCPPLMTADGQPCATAYLSVCPSVCTAGYEPEGGVPVCEQASSSSATGVWSAATQTCAPVACVPLTGSSGCSTTLNSYCHTTCADGYRVTGVVPQCVGISEDESAWTGPVQTCTPVSCAPLSDTSNCSNALGSYCPIGVCDAGYATTGDIPQCVGTGPGASDWTGPAQTCDPVACPAFADPASSSCNTDLNAYCTAVCPDGYAASGAIPQCVGTGVGTSAWSGPSQTCVAVPCIPLGDPASSNCSTALGVVCYATCPDGYAVGGAAPLCVGVAPGVSDWTLPAQTCSPVNCSPLAGTTGCANTLDSFCYTTCSSGYSVTDNAPQCVASGPGAATWTGSPQSCQPVPCSPLGDPASGACSTALLSYCYAACADGYTATGTAPQCIGQAAGVSGWSGPAQTCTPTPCTPFTDPASSSCSTALQSTCYATCTNGYSATGDVPQCIGTGPGQSAWTGPPQTCVAVSCSPLSDPASNACSNTLGSTCTAACSFGFLAVGSAPMCVGISVGVSLWSGPSQTCLPVACDPLQDPASSGCSDALMAVCYASCPNGYAATGAAPQCVGLAVGQSGWTGPPQTCESVACSPLGDPASADCTTELGSVCYADCANGYSATGSAPQCVGVAPGASAWTGPAQTCTLVPCSPFNDTESSSCSTSLGSFCFAMCPDGYVGTGTAPQCVGLAVGVSGWTGPAQTCAPVSCSVLGGYSSGCDTLLGSVCNASCPSGDEANGTAPVCIGVGPAAAEWSGPAQTCVLSACQSFGDAASAGCSNLPLFTCYAACSVGYSAAGQAPECVATSVPGVFAWTGPEQICVPVSCSPLGDPYSGGCSNALNSVCAAACPDGYQASGVAPRCVGIDVGAAGWTGPAQMCLPVSCPPFADPASSGCTGALTSYCYASCPGGYGAGPAPQCVASGPGTSVWVGSPQVCMPGCAPLPIAPPNATLGTCGFGAAEASVCSIVCDAPYNLLGDAVLTCTDGTWIGSQQCTAGLCYKSLPGYPIYLTSTVKTNTIKPSFAPGGLFISACSNLAAATGITGAEGRLFAELAAGNTYAIWCDVVLSAPCVESVCLPSFFEKSAVAQISTIYIFYVAATNSYASSAYDAVGTCCEGQWHIPYMYLYANGTYVYPPCITTLSDDPLYNTTTLAYPSALCPVMVGTSAGCNVTVGSYCTASCPVGFIAANVIAHTLPQCVVVNGTPQWSDLPQTCAPVICPALIGSTVVLRSAMCPATIGSFCNTTCPIGYTAVGAPPQCMSVNAIPAWSGSAQTCVPGCAPLTAAPPNATLGTCGATGRQNSTCSIVCDAPYNLLGDAVLTCTDGTWVGSQQCTAGLCYKSLPGYPVYLTQIKRVATLAANFAPGGSFISACSNLATATGVIGAEGRLFGELGNTGGYVIWCDVVSGAPCIESVCLPSFFETTTALQAAFPYLFYSMATNSFVTDAYDTVGTCCEGQWHVPYTYVYANGTYVYPPCISTLPNDPLYNATTPTYPSSLCPVMVGTSAGCNVTVGSYCTASCPAGFTAGNLLGHALPQCVMINGTSQWSDIPQVCVPNICGVLIGSIIVLQSAICPATLGSFCNTTCPTGYTAVGTPPQCTFSNISVRPVWTGSAQTCMLIS